MALSLVWLRRVPLVNSRRVRWPKIFLGLAPIAQSAEAVDLKSIQCGFESHWGHHVKSRDVLRLPSSSGHPICADLVSVGEDVHCESTAQEIHAGVPA